MKEISSKEEFEEVISEGCVLVDYYANWCGPCRQIAPMLEQISGDVVKVDVDANPEIAQQYNIQSLPTLVLFSNGREVERLVGVQSKGDIESLFQNC